MKWRYQANLRTLSDEDKIIGLWKKKMVLDAIYSISWARSSMNWVTLVRSWRKLLTDLEKDDLWGFPNKEISKSKTLDMVCAMRSFENINEETLKSDACEVGFQHMTDRHCQCCCETEGSRRRYEGWEWNLYCCEESKQFTRTSDLYTLFLKIMSVV
jgi:hypothetical protein